MLKTTERIVLAAAIVLTTLLVPQAAFAADDCGSGWYKESDGYFTKKDYWESNVDWRRNASTYHTGKVRFCTENGTFQDDENRRVLIGHPYDYALQSMVDKNGNYAQFCVRQTIDVRVDNVKSGDSWTIGGEVSKSSPGVSASYSAEYDDLTVTVARPMTCGASRDRITTSTSGIVLTGTNARAQVRWVQLTTRLRMVYFVNGDKYVHNHHVTENDYS